jgi:hypothetical protein
MWLVNIIMVLWPGLEEQKRRIPLAEPITQFILSQKMEYTPLRQHLILTILWLLVEEVEADNTVLVVVLVVT